MTEICTTPLPNTIIYATGGAIGATTGAGSTAGAGARATTGAGTAIGAATATTLTVGRTS